MTGPVGSLDLDEVRAVVRAALHEDLRYGPDITTMATVAADEVVEASVVSRQSATIAGVDVGLLVLDEVFQAGEYRTGEYEITDRIAEGARVQPGQRVLGVRGSTRGVLTAERTMLNLMCHLCGVATATAAWVDAVAGTDCRIRDSRKTIPGLRTLQKYAVRIGGGTNHRMGLGDAALIKDNHVVAAGSVVEALRAVRAHAPDTACEVEVDSLEQLDEVLGENVELVLLDNFPLWRTQTAVQRRNAISPATKLESSGGLTLDLSADYARTGIDYLAVGALTHSVPAVDLGLDL